MQRSKFANTLKKAPRGRWVKRLKVTKGAGYDASIIWIDSFNNQPIEVFEVDTKKGQTARLSKRLGVTDDLTCPTCGNETREYRRTKACNICIRPKPIWDKGNMQFRP